MDRLIASSAYGYVASIAVSQDGKATVNTSDPFMKLDSPTSIVGRSVVLHPGLPSLKKNVDAENVLSFDGESIVACGNIYLTN